MPDERCPRCNSLDCESRFFISICNECGFRFDPMTIEDHDYQFRAAARRWLELAGKEGKAHGR